MPGVFASSLILWMALFSNISAYGQLSVNSSQNNDDKNLFITMLNLERIRNQIILTEKSLTVGNKDMAFVHAYIPHSVIFPSVKDRLNNISSQSVTQLESLLTDLPISIKAGESVELQGKLQSDLRLIEQILDSISKQEVGQDVLSNKTVVANIVVFLLRDAEQSYRLSNAVTTTNQQQDDKSSNQQFSKVDYENSQGLVNISSSNYEKIGSSLDDRRRQEIDAFFSQLENSIVQKASIESISQLVTAIERDLAEYLSSSSSNQGATTQIKNQHSQYFSTIRNLLSDVITEVSENSNYKTAEKAAMTAYLDNYEYLEAPIERLNATLMEDIEVDMREELRNMLKEEQSPAAIQGFVDGILVKVSEAEQLLESESSLAGQNQTGASSMTQSRPGFADIEGLSQGFGIYTGERRQMGETEDPSKAAVRGDIDQIRIKLDESLSLFKQGKIQEALTTSRSAYLDRL